jgi:hypothetical protein
MLSWLYIDCSPGAGDEWPSAVLGGDNQAHATNRIQRLARRGRLGLFGLSHAKNLVLWILFAS